MTKPADEHDFRQFAGRFDRPVAPSPTFASALRGRLGLMIASAPSSVPLVVQAAPIPSKPVETISDRSADDVPWRAPRWMRMFEAAVATLLVLSLGGASLYFRQPEAVYDLAFQPVDSAASEFNYGGDAGRTWVLGDDTPEMGGFRQDPSMSQHLNPITVPLLVDDSYIIFTQAGMEYGLTRYDFSTKEAMWNAPLFTSGTLASDGKLIYAMRADQLASTVAATLVAIDFETGEIVWEGPELAHRFQPALSLVLADDTVYATDYLGNIVAVDKATGAVRWQQPETFAVPSPNEDDITGSQFYFFRPEIAVDDETVFLTQPSRTILALDRETGAQRGAINLVDRYGADIIQGLIQVRGQDLALTAIQAPRSEDPEAIRDYTPASILMFNAETLDLRFRTESFDFRGNLVLTEDAIYIATAATVEDHASVRRLDPATGALGEPLQGVSSRWDIPLSASGDVLMAGGDPSTIAFFDLATGELLDQVELGITNVETPFEQPVQMWGAHPIVITGLGEVYVVIDDPTAD